MAAGVLERLVLQTEAAALASADLLAADSRLPARLEEVEVRLLLQFLAAEVLLLLAAVEETALS